HGARPGRTRSRHVRQRFPGPAPGPVPAARPPDTLAGSRGGGVGARRNRPPDLPDSAARGGGVIAGLRGRLDAKLPDALLVDVGGVILRVGTSANTLGEVGEVGEPVRLQTYLFVREDQLTLYGFATGEELKLFETLITVTGVGPRLACAILSSLRVETLHEAIQAGN